MKPVGRRESDAILGAMRQVAIAGGRPLSYADTASIGAAARYLLRRHDVTDIGTLPGVEPADLAAALKADRGTAVEAVKYLAVMALVDGTLDHKKLGRVLAYSRALDVEEAYLTELVEAASGHMTWVIADMTARNFESVISKSSADEPDPAVWIKPYDGANARPDLVARYEAMAELPEKHLRQGAMALPQGQSLRLSG